MTSRPPRAPVLVLGLGNLLLRDEGLGVRVVEALAEHGPWPGVELADGGTSGLALADLMAGRQRVIVIDALAGPWLPGTVLRLEPDDLAREPDDTLSLHEAGLPEALRAVRLLGEAPDEVVLLGVVPKDVGAGLDLSPPIAALIPDLVRLVRDELERAAA